MGDTLQNFNLVLLPINNVVAFPKTALPFTSTDKVALSAIKEALANDKGTVFLSTRIPRNGGETVYKRGVIGVIRHVIETTDSFAKVVIETFAKADVMEFTQQIPHKRVSVKTLTDSDNRTAEYEEILNKIRTKLSPYIIPDIQQKLRTPTDVVSVLLDLQPMPLEALQRCLEQKDDFNSLVFINEFLNMQRSANSTEGTMFGQDGKTPPPQMGNPAAMMAARNQDKHDELEELSNKIKDVKFPPEVKKEIDKQLGKLNKLNPDMSEYYATRNYIDWLLDVPWDKETPTEFDLKKLRDELENSHYGLEDVKDRILEYMAVQKLSSKTSGSILCLIAPAGCGKTSIAKSIANSLGRKFVKIALGGIRDEAEIRGHRRTYVGAMPGKIIQALKQAGVMNPVILLDEIDKLGQDLIRGSPSAALLEVLDAEQHKEFQDHFINLGVDLSKVLFIATGNEAGLIERALYDRLEIIRMDGYSEREKVTIATKYLIPEVAEETCVPKEKVTITEAALAHMITKYTMESGVRDLRRKVESVFRKVAKDIVMGENVGDVEVTPKTVHKYLGPEKLFNDKLQLPNSPGIAFGMAWTGNGGDVLPIEVITLPEGKGEIQITGNLEKVMQESVRVSLAYLRSNAKKFGLEVRKFKNQDFHFHFPEGAVPKDGPSAGVAITIAILSRMQNHALPMAHAFTGEMTINGTVLAVGGIKEKVTAAKRCGITHVYLPKSNQRDVEKLDAKDVKGMTFYYVARFEEVYSGVRGK